MSPWLLLFCCLGVVVWYYLDYRKNKQSNEWRITGVYYSEYNTGVISRINHSLHHVGVEFKETLFPCSSLKRFISKQVVRKGKPNWQAGMATSQFPPERNSLDTWQIIQHVIQFCDTHQCHKLNCSTCKRLWLSHNALNFVLVTLICNLGCPPYSFLLLEVVKKDCCYTTQGSPPD